MTAARPRTDGPGIVSRTDGPGIDPRTDGPGIDPRTDGPGIVPRAGGLGIVVPVTVRRVAWDHPDAVALREAMVGEMSARYADRLADLPEGMNVEAGTVAFTGVAYDAGDLAVGHVGLRWAGPDLELKRMFVAATHRGAGVSTALLAAAEEAARALGVRRVILQTGDRQPDAVRLYEREGYTPIPIFPPYEALAFSRCFEKAISAGTVDTH